MKPTPTYDSAAQLPEHRMIAESPHENERTARRQGRHVFAFAFATPPATRCATAGAPCNNDGAASGRSVTQKRWRRTAAGASHSGKSVAQKTMTPRGGRGVTQSQKPHLPNHQSLAGIRGSYSKYVIRFLRFSLLLASLSKYVIHSQIIWALVCPSSHSDRASAKIRPGALGISMMLHPLLDALRTPSTPKNIVQRITYLG